MRIVVGGASGLIGRALCPALTAAGHQVVRLVRRSAGPGEVRWDPAAGALDAEAVADTDAVVHLAGAGLGERRWTEARRAELLGSRVDSTSLLARTVGGLPTPPQVFVSASAVGWYGSRGDEVLTEDSGPGRGFLAEVCRAWEAAAAPATDAGIRVVHVRSGVVLDPAGPALAKQLPLFRVGLGGRFGDGRQWLSWITLQDEVAAILAVLDDAAIDGPVNLTAPEPVTNAAFTAALAGALHHPAFARVPKAALRLALGRDLADELVLASQRVIPQKLVGAGFRFSQPEIAGALAAVLGVRAA